MNPWLRASIIGIMGAVLLFFLWDKIRGKKVFYTYNTHYKLRSEPLADSSIPYSFPEVLKAMEQRLRGIGHNYHLQTTGMNTFNVSVSDLPDTGALKYLFISHAKLQFMELYNIVELQPMLEKVSSITDSIRATRIPPIPLSAKRDSMSASVRKLLDSMEINQRRAAELEDNADLLQVNIFYNDGSGLNTFSPDIAKVNPADTSFVRKLFNRKDIKDLAPADAILCFGIPDRYKIASKEKHTIPLYFIRTYNLPAALLENKDVANVQADYNDQTGSPQISLEFTNAASHKWRELTKRNVNRSIAILIDGTVISAPKVIEEIPNGSTIISGSFTIEETMEMSMLIKGPTIPGSVHILSVVTKAEGETGERSKKLFAILAVFILFSGLSFIILKTLKSS